MENIHKMTLEITFHDFFLNSCSSFKIRDESLFKKKIEAVTKMFHLKLNFIDQNDPYTTYSFFLQKRV